MQVSFKEALIDYVKDEASTTGQHNALDRSVVFRDLIDLTIVSNST